MFIRMAAKDLIKRVFGGKSRTSENIILCIAAALAASFYSYEYYQPWAGAARLIVSAVLVTVWAYCGFVSGRDGKKSFAVFAASYWVIPLVYTYLYAMRDNVSGYSKLLDLLNKAAMLISQRPFAEIPALPSVCVLSMTVIVLSAFFAGTVFPYDNDPPQESGLL